MRLIDAFAETARRYPEKLALITEKSQLSFNDIIVLAAACEANLRPNGLRPGMRLVLTTDRPEFVLGFTLLASRLSLTLILDTTASAGGGCIRPDGGRAPGARHRPSATGADRAWLVRARARDAEC